MAETRANKVCILGGGNGAHAMAADLTIREGCKVNMCELPELKEGAFKKTLETGKIKASGIIEGIANLNLATTDFREAIESVKIIFVVVPSFGQQTFAERCAPYLEDRQIVVLPAANCGALAFARVLDEKGIRRDVVIAETATLPYGTRLVEPAHIGINARTVRNPIGVFPGKRINEVVDVLKVYFSEIKPVSNVIEACLSSRNAVLHPGPTLLNLGRIEYADEFRLYKEGMSPSVLKLMGTLMNEKREIGKALGFDLESGEKLIRMGTEGLRELFTTSTGEGSLEAGYAVKGPSSPQHRYVTEAVPYGLVLWESLGNMLNLKLPATSSIIELFSIINGTDFRAEGRTVNKLGISGMSVAELNKFLWDGEI